VRAVAQRGACEVGRADDHDVDDERRGDHDDSRCDHDDDHRSGRVDDAAQASERGAAVDLASDDNKSERRQRALPDPCSDPKVQNSAACTTTPSP
jgi:hypothetical protein